MYWKNNPGWIEYDSIKQPLYSLNGEREFFDENGNWVTSAVDGFDFKCLEKVGYIYYWTSMSGREEYILRVPIEEFSILLFDYLHIHGRFVIEDYVDGRDFEGEIIATRIIE